jgi:hypothetical protein
MELRKHPKMTFQGKPSWPPQWFGPHGPGHPLPEGEVGTLKEVYSKPLTANGSPHCYLIMEYDGKEYYASLLSDDPLFRDEICETLRGFIGVWISRIGSLDIR